MSSAAAAGAASSPARRKRLLMVAYHFPPLAGSSGIQRTLRFVQHLPRFDWEPLVLTTRAMAYERTSTDLSADIPPGTVVRRAFALDTARHLSIGGRYISAMARPDRWISWRIAAVREGMRMIREFKPDAIWSTYPIATAHLIGAELQRRSGLPWIADFRDPMAQPGYPADPKTWQQFETIEQTAARTARWCMFTTPSAAQTYRRRYPFAAERIVTLENGYDAESFPTPIASRAGPAPLASGEFTLLHSGIVYPEERDPTQLFVALREMRARGRVGSPRPPLKVRFRAAVHDEWLRVLATRHGVEDMIELLPPLPYREALEEMLRADGLLVMQASNCNEQIPAKIYEYLRAGRPIVCLSDPDGDTCGALRQAGIASTARLDDAQAIAALLNHVLAAEGPSLIAHADAVAAASRKARTEQLAVWLNHSLH